MNISFDPAELSPGEAEAFATFILQYKGLSAPQRLLPPLLTESTAKPTAEAADFANKVDTMPVADLPDTGASTPIEAFGDPVAQAFPLVLEGQQPAPYIAAAVQSTTAPAANIPTLPAVNVPPNVAPVASNTVVPMAPVAPSTPANGVDLDKNGLPWDARIHASTKTKTAKGAWTTRRGADPAVIEQVEAELRKLMGAPIPQATNGAWPFTPPAPQQGPTPANVPSAMPLPPGTAPQQGPTPANATFISLVQRVGAAKAAGKLTDAELQGCLSACGIAALPLAMSRPDLLPALDAQITAILATRG